MPKFYSLLWASLLLMLLLAPMGRAEPLSDNFTTTTTDEPSTTDANTTTTSTAVPTSTTETPTSTDRTTTSSSSTTTTTTTEGFTTTTTTTDVPNGTMTPSDTAPPAKVYPRQAMLSHLSFAVLIGFVIAVYYLALLISSMAVGESPDFLLMPLKMLKTLALSCVESLRSALDKERRPQGYTGLAFEDDDDDDAPNTGGGVQGGGSSRIGMGGTNQAIRIVE